MDKSKMVKVRATAHFSSSQFGTFTPGEILVLPPDAANRYVEKGLVVMEPYESKPYIQTPSIPTVTAVKQNPKTEATDLGGDEPSTLSQQDQVSHEQTATVFRRGRRRKTDASSQ
jgi:hypothetical protein